MSKTGVRRLAQADSLKLAPIITEHWDKIAGRYKGGLDDLGIAHLAREVHGLPDYINASHVAGFRRRALKLEFRREASLADRAEALEAKLADVMGRLSKSEGKIKAVAIAVTFIIGKVGELEGERQHRLGNGADHDEKLAQAMAEVRRALAVNE